MNTTELTYEPGERPAVPVLRRLLQDVLDFIGVEGVVDERYAHRRDQLCASLRVSLRELDRLA